MATEPSTAPGGAEPVIDRRFDRSDRSDDRPRLLDRDPAVGELTAIFQPGRTYPVGAILLEGPPGTGRTALLHHAAGLAEASGSKVLRARANHNETHRPLGLLDQITTQLAAAGALPARARTLLGALDRSAITRPDLSPLFELLDQVLVGYAAARTVTITVDDLHWADPESVLWLCYLARRIESRPVHLVATLWPVVPSRTSTPLDELLTEHSTRRIPIGSLTRASVATLVDLRLGRAETLTVDDGLGAACYDATGGNPALLFALLDQLARRNAAATGHEELRRVLTVDPPAAVVRSVLRRADAAGPRGLAVLEGIHVLGTRPDLDTLAAVADAPRDEVLAALRALRVAGLIDTIDPPHLQHPLEAAAIREAVPPDRWRALHERAAEHLLAVDADPAAVAPHLLPLEPAGDRLRVETLRRAAAQARARGDSREARRYLDRAVEEPPPPEIASQVEVELALVEVALRDPRAAARIGAVAADPPALHLLTPALVELVTAPRAVRQRANDLLRAATATQVDHATQVDQRIRLVEALLVTPSKARKLLGRLLGDVSGELERLATVQLATTVSLSPGRATASALVRDILANLEPRHLYGSDPLAHLVGNQAVLTLLHLGEHDAAHRLVSAGLRQDGGSARQRAGLLRLAARIAQERGQLSRAAVLRRRFDSTEAAPLPGFHTVTAAWDADLLALDGRYDEGLGLLEDARRFVDPATLDISDAFAIDEAAGWLLLWRGDTGDALDAFHRASALAESRGVDNPAVTSWRAGAALALVETGATNQAAALASDDVARARAFGAPYPLARGLVSLAPALPPNERSAVLREAVEVLEGRTPAFNDLRIRLVLGQQLVAAGEHATARAVLRVAADMAQRVGSELLMQRARASLLAAGARPRRLAMTGPAALTPAELRVARLAASGATNQVISEQLFINVKTVESHLARTFRKLGVTARSQLPDHLPDDAEAPEVS